MLARKYRNEIIIALAALAIAAAWLPIRMRFPFDDTYITFRYAANLAHGFGIVWNHGGAHTEGYTNFLFMLMLVPFSAMGCDLVIVSQAIGVVAIVVSAIAIFWIVANGEWRVANDSNSNAPQFSVLRSPFAILATALFLLDPFIWFNAYSGMETSLFTMWLLLSVATVHRRWLPFVFATLAALTRPEGAIIGFVIVIVALWAFIQKTKGTQVTQRPLLNLWNIIRPVIYFFVLPLLLYGLWKLWYFDDLLPNSFYIKVAQASSPAMSGYTFLPGRGSMRIFYEGVWYLVILAIVAAWKGRKNSTIQIAVLWCIMLSVFYLFSHLISNEYLRFTNSAETMLIVLAGFALGSYCKTKRTGNNRWIKCAAFAVLIMLHIFWSYHFRYGRFYMHRDEEYQSRYSRIAPVLRSIPNHDRITLAWGDAGRLPYYSELRNIDPVGLNTNEIAHAHSPQEIIDFIMRSKPDLIIIPLSLPSHENGSGDTCYTVLHGGDGLIGAGYPELAAEVMASTYKPIAIIPQTIYDLDILADTLSVHYRDIVNVIVPRIGRDPDFLPPAECAK